MKHENKKHDAWELVNLPSSKKAIGCKCVYKIKANADGTIERYKARLVAQLGTDYDETFCPGIIQATSSHVSKHSFPQWNS